MNQEYKGRREREWDKVKEWKNSKMCEVKSDAVLIARWRRRKRVKCSSGLLSKRTLLLKFPTKKKKENWTKMIWMENPIKMYYAKIEVEDLKNSRCPRQSTHTHTKWLRNVMMIKMSELFCLPLFFTKEKNSRKEDEAVYVKVHWKMFLLHTIFPFIFHSLYSIYNTIKMIVYFNHHGTNAITLFVLKIRNTKKYGK